MVSRKNTIYFALNEILLVVKIFFAFFKKKGSIHWSVMPFSLDLKMDIRGSELLSSSRG